MSLLELPGIDQLLTGRLGLAAQAALLSCLLWERRRRRVARNLSRRCTQLQQAVANRAIRLLRVPHERIDQEIDSGLEEIGRGLQLERVAIWLRNDQRAGYRLANWWADKNIEAPAATRFFTPVETAITDGGVVLQHGNGEPAGAFVAILIDGDHSVVGVPLPASGAAEGFVSLEPLPHGANWYDVVLPALPTIAETLGIAVDRRYNGAHPEPRSSAPTDEQVYNKLHELAHASRAITVGTLAGSLAHEVSQPLTAIMSNAQAALRLLGKGSMPVEQLREILEDIVADDRRAGEVMQVVRSFLKKQEVARLPVQVSELVHDTVRLVADEALLRRVSIKLGLDTNLPLVNGDPVQLRQVVLNLLLNSFDALDSIDPAERELAVVTSTAGDHVELLVDDHGLGVPDSNLASIFEPFVTTKRSGLGLGLHITRAIVEAHGGSIAAEPRPDHGLRMRVKLPIAN
jgi:C4-dicarboxylate-specific signal transduction histidine kinase